MTTCVTVSAHCPDTIEVIVSVTDTPDVVLQNGEASTTYVHDDRVVSVREVSKDRTAQPAPAPAPLSALFQFALGQRVKVSISSEFGEVSARAEYQNYAHPTYRLKYMNAMGVATEGWFDQCDLTAAEDPADEPFA